MASDPTHALEVYGQVFVEGTEGGRRSQRVPFEIYSDYSSTNFGTRNSMKFSTQASDVFMGFENYNGDNFFLQRKNIPAITLDTDKNIIFSQVDFGVSNITSQNIDAKKWRSDYTYLNCKQISLGYQSTFIIDDNDDLFACGSYGSDGFGVGIGLGSHIEFFTPIKLLNNISDVHSSNYTLIIKKDGSVWGSGKNNYGQLGLGPGSPSEVYSFTQEITSMTDASEIFPVDEDSGSSIILKNDGSIWGAGSNYNGQLGLGGSILSVDTFTLITNDVKQGSGGKQHLIILKNDGSVWGTGSNYDGQLGLGSIGDVGTFTSITNDVKQVYATENHTLILKNDGSVWGTGSNGDGQLGLGSIGGVDTFTSITNDVKYICSGGRTSLIIKNDGSVWGTGNNEYGVFGNGTTISSKEFINTYNCCDNKIYIARNRFSSTSVIQQSSGKTYGAGYNGPGKIGLPKKMYYPYTVIPTFSDMHVTNFTRAFGVLNENTIGGGNNLYINSRFSLNSVNSSGLFEIKNTSSSQKTQSGIQLIASNTSNKIFNQHNIKLNDDDILIGLEAYEMSVDKQGTVSSVGGFAHFTGSHIGITDKNIEPGFITSIDPLIKPQIVSINNIIPTLKIASIDNDPNVYGVSSDGKTFNAVGEGAIWVSDVNGTFSLGDYITSSTLSGYGKRQDSEFMTNYTVGKILQNCDFQGDDTRHLSVSSDNAITVISKEEYLTNTGSVYRASLVGCTYHCG